MSKRKGDPGQPAGWCVHYEYDEDPRCTAGVNLRAWEAGPTKIAFDKRPCFLTPTGESKPDSVPCIHLRRPTAEEIGRHNEWIKGRAKMMVTVMQAILPWREANQDKSAVQVRDCPVCGKMQGLRLAIAGNNGHVQAHCQTVGCVSWIE